MLLVNVLPELESDQPFLRLRACHTYGVYGKSIKIQDKNHIQKIVEGIYKNMSEDSPLPVKFYAASALRSMLEIDDAKAIVRPGLEQLLKCYLSLMSELDNEELVESFEDVMQIFSKDIAPFACHIC